MTLIATKTFYSAEYIQGRLLIYQTDKSVTANTSKVTVTLSFRRTNTYGGSTSTAGSDFVLGIAGSTKTIASSFSIGAYDTDWHDVGSYSKTVTHSSDGSKTVTVTSEYDRSSSYFNHDVSYSVTLETIPRQSTASASNINIGDTATIYTNRASSNFTHKVTVTYGSTSVVLGTAVGASVEWDTSGIADGLLQLCPSSKYVTVTIETVTYNGSTTIGTTTSTFKAYANVYPTVSSVTYADNNSDVTAITGSDQIIVKSKSTLVITVTATAQQYTTLSTASVTIAGTAYEGTFSGSTATISVGAVTLSETTTLSAAVTDSRGYVSSLAFTVTAVDYATPSMVCTAVRKYGYYSETACVANVTYSSLGGANAITILVDGQQNGTGDYTTAETLTNYQTKNVTFDNGYAWKIRFRATDSFGSTVTQIVEIGKGIPIMMIDRKHSSVGFNQFPEHDDSVEISGSLYVNSKPILVENSWTALTLIDVSQTNASTVGQYLHVTPSYKLIGNEVHLKGHIAFTAGSEVTVCTLPEGARPSDGLVMWFAPLTGANIARCKITTAGVFTIEWVRDIATGTASTDSISWLDISHVFSID